MTVSFFYYYPFHRMLSSNSLRFYLPIFRIISVYNYCKFRNFNLWLYDIGNKIFKKGYVKGDNTVHKRLKYERLRNYVVKTRKGIRIESFVSPRKINIENTNLEDQKGERKRFQFFSSSTDGKLACRLPPLGCTHLPSTKLRSLNK